MGPRLQSGDLTHVPHPGGHSDPTLRFGSELSALQSSSPSTLGLSPASRYLQGVIRRVKVPFKGEIVVTSETRQRVDEAFAVPMLVASILFVPVLLFDLYYEDIGYPRSWMEPAMTDLLGLIWLAFAAEFTVKCAIAANRVTYAKRHWIDVLILLLPFLSPLRATAALRGVGIGRLVAPLRLRWVGMKLVAGAAYVWSFLRRLRGGRRPSSVRREQVTDALTREDPVVLARRIRELEVQVKDLERELAEVYAARRVATPAEGTSTAAEAQADEVTSATPPCPPPSEPP